MASTILDLDYDTQPHWDDPFWTQGLAGLTPDKSDAETSASPAQKSSVQDCWGGAAHFLLAQAPEIVCLRRRKRGAVEMQFEIQHFQCKYSGLPYC